MGEEKHVASDREGEGVRPGRPLPLQRQSLYSARFRDSLQGKPMKRGIKKGDAVGLDGQRLTPAKLLTRLNEIGGANGIGRLKSDSLRKRKAERAA